MSGGRIIARLFLVALLILGFAVPPSGPLSSSLVSAAEGANSRHTHDQTRGEQVAPDHVHEAVLFIPGAWPPRWIATQRQFWRAEADRPATPPARMERPPRGSA